MATPDGGTTVRTFQPDGRLASVTGSAVVAQYYSYAPKHVSNGLSGEIKLRVF